MRTRLLQKEHEKLASSHKEAKYRFILTELDLAITFCDVALSSVDLVRSTRNSENARQAYKAASHFLEDANFSEKRMTLLGEKVAKLRTLLRRVDRHEQTLADGHASPPVTA